MKKYITKCAVMGHEVSASRNLGVMDIQLPRLKPTVTERVDNLNDIIKYESSYDDDNYSSWSKWEFTIFVVYSSQASRKRNIAMIKGFLDEMDGESYPSRFLSYHADELRKILGRKGFAKLCRRYNTSAREMMARHTAMLKMEEEKRVYRQQHPRRPRGFVKP